MAAVEAYKHRFFKIIARDVVHRHFGLRLDRQRLLGAPKQRNLAKVATIRQRGSL